MSTFVKIIWLILGLLVGLALALFVGLKILFNRAQMQKMVEQTQLAVTLEYQLSITPSPTPTPSPQELLDAIFNQAEEDILNNAPEKAGELLLPLVDQDLSLNDLSRLFGDLGDMELYQGHTRIACNYYQKQYSYEHTPDVLYNLAGVCFESGMLIDAIAYYEELVNWQGTDADLYRETAQYMLDHIRISIGTMVPTNSVE